VIGYGSVVTGRIPNNCIAVGTPARVLRRDTVRERTHLSLRRPFYKPDPGPIRDSPYWRLTENDDGADRTPERERGAVRALHSLFGRLRR
jgi:hypothetical protein